MYNSRAYDWTRNAAVRENGTMGRHASDSPPPMIVGDSGKRRPIRDRLQNITSAMSWIKEELEGLKEQDKSLINLFQKVQGDVKELNGFVSNHRSSSSLQGTPLATTKTQPPPAAVETNLELDFDALDDDDLSDKHSSLSATPSPPLARDTRTARDARELTTSNSSYSNLDRQSNLDVGGSRENLSGGSTHRGRGQNNVISKENGISDKDCPPGSPSGPASISLGSLDLDFSVTSFGLGTITEGRSLMNIPMTSASSSSSAGDSPAVSSKADIGGLQRSISQQPLQNPIVADKGRNLSYQPPKKQPPATAPKPRRGNSTVVPPSAGGLYTSQKPPLNNHLYPPHQSPKTSRQTSEVVERMSPQQARKEMMRSTPALFPSPPRTRRNTDSLPRPGSKVMLPLLPFQAQQELREAARQAKQELAGKKASNGVIPHMQQGSPLLLRKGAKQPSPPLPYRSSGSVRQSPKHPPTGQRVSPPSRRPHPHLSPGMKPSSSMSHLPPSVSRAQEESNMSRNSSIDSGIQYSSEGESAGGGGTVGERASNTSTASSGSTVTSDSIGSGSVASSGLGEGGKEGPAAGSQKESEKKPGAGLGDFSDVLSVIANMGGGDSWFS